MILAEGDERFLTYSAFECLTPASREVLWHQWHDEGFHAHIEGWVGEAGQRMLVWVLTREGEE